MRPHPPNDRIARFLDDSFTLDPGGHPSFAAGHCATEAGAWLAGEEHTDRPSCMSPIVAQFLRTLSDSWRHEARQALKPYVLSAIGTDHDGRDLERVDLCRTWLIRHALPEALELAGCRDTATRLRLDTAATTEKTASKLLRQTRKEVWRARHDAYRSVPERPAPALATAAAAAQAAGDAAAGAGAVAAAVYAEAGAHLTGFPADAGSYADAATVAARATTGTFADAAAACVYSDPAALSPGQLEPLADRLNAEVLSLLDRMLPAGPALSA